MKARIFTKANESGRYLLQIINTEQRLVFNGYIKEDEMNYFIAFGELIYYVDIISKKGDVKESVKVDQWAYDRNIVPINNFNRFINITKDIDVFEEMRQEAIRTRAYTRSWK